MLSWPTGYTGRPNCLSVKILITELLVGKKWNNAFFKPKYPMAKNAEEAFCSDYTPEDCNAAVDRIESKVVELLSQSFGILLLDTNQVAFKGTTRRCKRGAGPQLLKDFDFVRKAALPGDEVVLYMNGALHLVFLHRPFCIAGDSRLFIPMAWRCLRAFTVAVLLNILRRIRGVALLRKHEEFGNPINAMVICMILKCGLHVSLRIMTAFFKDVVSPSSTNALLQNNLGQLPGIWNQPVGLRLHQKRDAPPTLRENKSDIFLMARVIISQAKVPSDLFCVNTRQVGESGKDLVALLSAPGKDGKPLTSAGICKHWESVREFCKEGTPLHALIVAFRQHIRKNAGNAKTGTAKSNPDVGTLENDDFMDQLEKDHGPPHGGDGKQRGKPFWVAMTQRTKNEPPPNPDQLGGHPLKLDMCHAGILTRLDDKQIKGNTNKVKSKKYPHLRLRKAPKRFNCPNLQNKDGSMTYGLHQFARSKNCPLSVMPTIATDAGAGNTDQQEEP